ncbi:MAG: hypothetical protein Q8N35_14750 [Methylococcaceae bacterium]|nr:hypothetical protein [Methylococcaceae bacterium]MDZ4157766.1 protein YgfX [Methylococcales bacterium]MDP2392109.1 hypothetical protein [Methylococcaceae bacterium]MDP3020839.1 hypothetical protein [Methylococcaceae bacterium]MDP3391657.1 hypothetical protein [Methylococcaceae bacterium]
MHKQQTPLSLELKSSTRLKQVVILIHLLAAAACIYTALAIAIQISLLTVVAIHFYYLSKRLKTTFADIKYSEMTGWEISEADEPFASVQILTTTVTTTFAVILHYQYDSIPSRKAIKTLLIMHDALPKNDFRQLLVSLKTTKNK